ncbi:MAG: DUF1552 domain-containing protein, partial [Planctomycetaceae bacterium]|nr:DUF1552 domain-containing protein [Planctomycetaceae bacterium]
PTLNLGVNIDRANRSLSWTRDGVLLPAEDSALRLFRQLFLDDSLEAQRRQQARMEERASILDALTDDTRQLHRELNSRDQQRLDQYLTSVRELEERLHATREWESRPRPEVQEAAPEEVTDQRLFFRRLELMLSMSRLALETDSTRIITLMIDAFATPAFRLHPEELTTDGYHNLSHHGQAPDKLRQLQDVDHQQLVLLRNLLQELTAVDVGNGNLLDQTMVLFGSNMGDSNTHDNSNLPILLAGGGLRHGQHLAYPQDRNRPLSDLFVTILQRMGVAAEQFGSSTGTLNELL